MIGGMPCLASVVRTLNIHSWAILRVKYPAAEAMTQQLKVGASFAEDPGLVLSTASITPVPGYLRLSSGIQGHCTCERAHTPKLKKKIFFEKDLKPSIKKILCGAGDITQLAKCLSCVHF